MLVWILRIVRINEIAMDYELKKDYLGKPFAKFSMGHEAFSHWFTEELSNDIVLVDKILSSVSKVENRSVFEKHFCGKSFELTLEFEQVVVRALLLDYDTKEDLGDDLEVFDQELMSDCGLPDFKDVLVSWREFIS